MIELFPEGFEEASSGGSVELSAYTDAGGEERLWGAFGAGERADVEEDWETRWQRFHQPVTVGELWIGPPWEDPPPASIAVVIEPGRAFGTGSHSTTRLCLDLLGEQPRGSLLDVGCGSGVLAIAAAKLGFSPIFALDSDPLAIEATRRNADLNGVALEAWGVDALVEPLPAADVAVANITLEAVKTVVPRLSVTRLVTSGYLASEEPRLPGYRHLERRTADGWAADLYVARTE